MIIWLASYPRSGNTFFRVLLKSVFGIETYSIYNDRGGIGADKKTSAVVGHKFLPENFDLEKFRSSKEIYYIKTHDLPDKVMIGKNDKVVYIVRDGRESCLSFARYIQNYNGGKENVLFDVLWGKTTFGSWGEHIDKWSRVEKFLVKFEELVADPLRISLDLANYLGIKPINDKIPTFKELHLINPVFFRSGKNNSWKENFSGLDNIIFWMNNYKGMLDMGYVEDMPNKFLKNNN